MKGFIELTKNGYHRAVAIDSIRGLLENEDGTTRIVFKSLSSWTLVGPEPNFPTTQFVVDEPYEVIKNKIMKAESI